MMGFWKITSFLVFSILALYHMGLFDVEDSGTEEETIYLLEDDVEIMTTELPKDK